MAVFSVLQLIFIHVARFYRFGGELLQHFKKCYIPKKGFFARWDVAYTEIFTIIIIRVKFVRLGISDSSGDPQPADS